MSTKSPFFLLQSPSWNSSFHVMHDTKQRRSKHNIPTPLYFSFRTLSSHHRSPYLFQFHCQVHYLIYLCWQLHHRKPPLPLQKERCALIKLTQLIRRSSSKTKIKNMKFVLTWKDHKNHQKKQSMHFSFHNLGLLTQIMNNHDIYL